MMIPKLKINKAAITGFFTKGKVMFATIAAVVTFSITMYNQFKSNRITEISGTIAGGSNLSTPVDALVRISSPIQAQTETDSRGRFKFKFENLQSDTFLLIVVNKRTNTVAKQNEYVNASKGRTDIVVNFTPDMQNGQTYTSYRDTTSTGHHYRGPKKIRDALKSIFR